jgi:tetratricopeptide (TPR) repeat protein
MSEAKEHFRDAQLSDPQFSRAFAWEGYTVVREWIEGYQTAGLDEALRLTEKATGMEPHDYDNHWACAIAQLFALQWDNSLKSYKKARELDVEENVHLNFDYSDALVYMGYNREALRMALDAGGRGSGGCGYRDWHRWNTAWAYFFYGGKEFRELGDSLYWDRSLELINDMHLPVGHKRYMTDAQLLVAVIQIFRKEVSLAKAAMEIYRKSSAKGTWKVEDEERISPFDTRDETQVEIPSPNGRENHALWVEGVELALDLPK